MPVENIESLLHITESLIRFRSTNRYPQNLAAAADFVENFFAGTGLTVRRLEKNGVPSLVISKKEEKHPTVFLCGHLDVVEGTDDQFEPRRAGDKLIGRGALDMHSGNAAMMSIMKELASTEHSVGLMLTGDEERGGFDGVAKVLEEGYASDIVIIPDGGMDVNNIIVQEKGVLRFRLEANGKEAHGAYPWKGANAIRKLTEAIEAIGKEFPTPGTDHPNHWISTASVTKIEGGHTENVVPAVARAWYDVRYIPGESADDIVLRIQSLLPDGVTVEAKWSDPSTSVDVNLPLIQEFVSALRIFGKEPSFISAHGASDARYFSARNTPFIICQPHGAGHHGADEWVDIPSIGLYRDVVRAYLDRVALREGVTPKTEKVNQA